MAAEPTGLHVVRGGTRGAEPVLLLHSLGLDLTYWGRQFEHLGADHEVVAADLPGHGRSPAPAAGWTFDAAVAELSAVLDGLGPVHVAGCSLGGMVAQALALARPDLVRTLSLLSTAATFADPGRDFMRGRGRAVLDGGMPAALPSLEGWLSEGTRRRRPDLVERVTRTLLAGDPAAYAAACAEIAGFETLDRLGGLRCPALVLVCADDASTPPAAAEAMAAALPAAGLVVLPGGAHLSYLEQPDAVNAALSRFLTAHR